MCVRKKKKTLAQILKYIHTITIYSEQLSFRKVFRQLIVIRITVDNRQCIDKTRPDVQL